MATIAFNALGTYLGGPIGGAIGSLLGRQVDGALFGANRQGPRLAELAVTTSSYGQPIPRHFGRMRVAGSIIWATDLVEQSEVQGGKGAPSITTYSYTANFAVALASRPIQAIGRIWADGRLLRGAAGDLKVGGTLRIHTGQGDQPPDPLILAAEGAGRCPAHRDLAYVVFENLDLAEFYNHIPALTFEVIADDAFDLADVIGDLVDDVDAAVPLQAIAGYTCDGPLSDALQSLGQVIPLQLDAAGEPLVITRERLQDGAIALAEAAIAAGDDAMAPASGFARHRAQPSGPRPAALRYYDVGRDYLPGIQRASGQPLPGEPITVELPAALDAASARAAIERSARRFNWDRERISWRTCELDPSVAPGAIVTLPDVVGRWRVQDWEWREAGVELSLERVAPSGADAPPQLGSDPGRTVPPLDAPPSATALVAFELPLGPGDSPDAARPVAAVSSASSSWSGAALYADRGDGALHPLGPSGRARNVVGITEAALPAASPLLFDRHAHCTVSLVDPAMPLASASIEAIAAGGNLALVGQEILQFIQATALGDGRWRLQGLLRGRGGTEAAIGTHDAGEPFVLLDGRHRVLDPATLGLDPARQVIALGRGDPAPVAAPVLLSGITLRPLPPVHPRREVLADGTWRLTWTRRARGGWGWQDGVDVPLVEQKEAYLVTLGPLDAELAQWTLDKPRLDIPPPLLADLMTQAFGETFRVRQQGTHALSEPCPICTLS